MKTRTRIALLAAAFVLIGGGCAETRGFAEKCIEEGNNYVSTKHGFVCSDPEHFLRMPERAW